MNHWIIAPILLPAVAAGLLVLFRLPQAMQRLVSLGTSLALAAIAIGLALQSADGNYAVYSLGNWPAPYGIVLVLDRLSALMLALTAVIACWSLLQAVRGSDAQSQHFHALFQFQLMGLNAAFLTGDLFNLFVAFEILLIASYCLLLHGGKTSQLAPGIHYVAVNFAGSFLFLISVSMLYAMTGTLNMADMAVQIARADAQDAALIRSAGLLMLVVFAIKAALLPLYFWLPRAYGAAEAPVAALFAIMTKLGVYVIIRVYTLIFGPQGGVGADLATPWLLPAALLTLVVATLGVLSARTLRGMVSYLTIASVGTICIGVGIASIESIGAALFYLLHSTLAIALLFLLADMIRRGRGGSGDRIVRGAALPQSALLGGLFLGAGIAVVGTPPLGGFQGKLLLLQASAGHPASVWIWAAVLLNALLGLVALARAGSTVFWHTDGNAGEPVSRRAVDFVPVAGLSACLIALSIWANPIATHTAAAAQQLLQPGDYITGVLGSSRAGALMPENAAAAESPVSQEGGKD